MSAGAGAGAGADDDLLALFDRWVERQEALAGLEDTADNGAIAAACAAADDVLGMIARTPARGGVGLAVKVYLSAHVRHGGTRGSVLTIALPPEEEGPGAVCDALQRGLLADARRLAEADGDRTSRSLLAIRWF